MSGVWLGPNGEVAREVSIGPRYPGADLVLHAVYAWCAMAWAQDTTLESCYLAARRADAASERAKVLGAELTQAAARLIGELDSGEWDCTHCGGLSEQPEPTQQAARKLEDVLIKIDMERAR